MQRIIGGSIALGIALGCATASAQGKIDNIGNAGGIVIGAERLAGFYVTKANTQSERSQTVGGTTDHVEERRRHEQHHLRRLWKRSTEPNAAAAARARLFPIDGLSFGGLVHLPHDQRGPEGEASRPSAVSRPTTTQDRRKAADRISAHRQSAHRLRGRVQRDGRALAARRLFLHAVVREQEDRSPTPGQRSEPQRDATTSLTHLTLEGLLFVSPFTGFAFVGGPFVDVGLGGSDEDRNEYEPDIEDSDFDTKLTAYGLTIGIAGYFDTQ